MDGHTKTTIFFGSEYWFRIFLHFETRPFRAEWIRKSPQSNFLGEGNKLNLKFSPRVRDRSFLVSSPIWKFQDSSFAIRFSALCQVPLDSAVPYCYCYQAARRQRCLVGAPNGKTVHAPFPTPCQLDMGHNVSMETAWCSWARSWCLHFGAMFLFGCATRTCEILSSPRNVCSTCYSVWRRAHPGQTGHTSQMA